MPLTRESDWGCVRMREVTIRKQKIKKDSVKFRLIVFGTLAVLLIVCSFFSEYLTPCDPYLQDLSIAKQPPDAEHLLGTDRYGRDMLSRVIVGSRTSIFSTLLLVAIITALGTAVGVVCGWNGKALDTVLMRISDLFLAFPGLVFALAVAGVLGGGLQNAIIALAAISWPKYARLARAAGLGGSADTVAVRNLRNGLLRLRTEMRLPATLSQAGVDPRQLWHGMDKIVRAVLEDPCCRSNPMTVEGFMVRRILEEVAGRV